MYKNYSSSRQCLSGKTYQRTSHLLRLLVVVLLLVGAAACSRVSQNRSLVNATSGPKEQIMVDLGWDEYHIYEKGFDPTMGWHYAGPPLFQSTLLSRNENFELVNDLAQSYTISSDRLVWTVKIRQDVRFTDGQPLLAEDVAYTFNTTKDSLGRLDMEILDRAVATGKYQVELHLKRPDITFVNQLASLGIVPKYAHNKDYARNPIGSGPYKLVQWNQGEQVIIEVNPDYYGHKPVIKRVILLFTQGDAAFAAARAGQVQVAAIPNHLASQPVEGMKTYVIKSLGHAGLMFPYPPRTGRKTPDGNPIGNDVTSNRAIRQAVNYAIDRQTLVQTLFNGYGSPAMSPASGLPWDEPTADIQDGDINKAKQILSEDGWRDTNGDGIVEKQRLKAEFTLLYNAQDAFRQGLALAVAQMLKPVGIKVNVEGRSWTEIERRMQSNVVLYALETHDSQQLSFLFKSSLAQGKYQNPGYYSNSVVDRALDRAAASATETEAIQFWKQVQWDGQTGVTTKGDAASAWLVNIDKTYLISTCLDVSKATEKSRHYTLTLLYNLPNWKWICQ
ncbi:ABC transporter substrate-binding protein [Nostoc flagelliforme FACHB-838]|uniref:ABC transporter substrate-binding protein n=1 Tax=Nostoc flagelliforme FACHB-838 TaxID=2692904 RepID=A0ABR8E0G1_9NOSO|nr:ABC transporter substrate-binding protein [Nostoc flagelliforme]MBD2534695.1 ABC transporter substrate-binding protein [Nostoc flagelliforme FACHB-838]